MSTIFSPSVQNICINKPEYTTEFLVGVISVQSKPNSVSLQVQSNVAGGCYGKGVTQISSYIIFVYISSAMAKRELDYLKLY